MLIEDLYIQEARDFVHEVDDAIINSKTLPDTMKSKARWSSEVVNNIKKIGDLNIFLKRYYDADGKRSEETYTSLKSAGFKTYEDIYESFRDKYKSYFNSVTTLDDFIIGEYYSTYDLTIFAKVYFKSSGGILPIKVQGKDIAIFCKATLYDGAYKNEWVNNGDDFYFKYYMKSHKGSKILFDPNRKENKAIIKSNEKNTPIYLFTRNNESEKLFKLEGIFYYTEYIIDNNHEQSKWFKFYKRDSLQNKVVSKDELQNEIDKDVTKSLNDSSEVRKERLKNAPKIPEVIKTITTNYKRNADVIAEVLKRANGICEHCGKQAPFIRAKDRTPYLEVHHRKPLAEGGEDTVENAEALCPNCHAEKHFGINFI
jgi:5-methylcytosine-specific restriction enzyme A